MLRKIWAFYRSLFPARSTDRASIDLIHRLHIVKPLHKRKYLHRKRAAAEVYTRGKIFVPPTREFAVTPLRDRKKRDSIFIGSSPSCICIGVIFAISLITLPFNDIRFQGEKLFLSGLSYIERNQSSLNRRGRKRAKLAIRDVVSSRGEMATCRCALFAPESHCKTNYAFACHINRAVAFVIPYILAASRYQTGWRSKK